jgi:outer membrane biosynthesis protein TonB
MKSVYSAPVVLAFLAVLLIGQAGSVFAQNRQLSLADVLVALRSKKAEPAEKNRIITEAIKDRGLTFSLTPEIEKELVTTGAGRDLIDAIREKTSPPAMEKPTESKPQPTQIAAAVPKPTPTPLDHAFYRSRATTYLTNVNLDLAVLDLTKAIELKPDDSASYLDRGTIFVKQSKIEAAVADFDKAIELNTKDSAAFYQRAAANEKLRKMAAAISDYDQAAALDPANESAKSAAARLKQVEALTHPKSVVEAAKPKPEPPAGPSIIALGAMNRYATHLVVPVYSQIDRKLGISGKVTVQIVLDENGKLITAQATDGPKALRQASEEAARKSTFMPVVNGGKPVKATGFIVYNFTGTP